MARDPGVPETENDMISVRVGMKAGFACGVAVAMLSAASWAEEPQKEPGPSPMVAEAAASAPDNEQTPSGSPPQTLEVAPPPPAPKAPPPPYSLPWQLRPAAAATVVRSDTAIGFYQNAALQQGSTVATMLLGSYKILPALAPMVRLGFVKDSPPGGARGGESFVNPAVGATYLFNLNDRMRLSAFLGVALPLGSGGGNTPTSSTSAARLGVLARSAMDNAMFALNDLTVFPGVDFAFLYKGLTIQAEATVLQLTRVRGELVQKDASRTNFTSGVHLGYFLHPMVSVGGEIRLQRWLSTPAAVAADATQRENLSFAVGPRFHFKLADKTWIRPGIAYARGLDDPMAKNKYSILQVDVPVAF